MNKSVLPLYIDVFAGLQPLWILLIFLEASKLLNFTIDNTFSQWNWLTQFKSSWSVMNMADWCWLLPIFLSNIRAIVMQMSWCLNQRSSGQRCLEMKPRKLISLLQPLRDCRYQIITAVLLATGTFLCFRSGTCHRKPVRSDGLPRWKPTLQNNQWIMIGSPELRAFHRSMLPLGPVVCGRQVKVPCLSWAPQANYVCLIMATLMGKHMINHDKPW